MNEFERLVQTRLEESFKKRLDEASCDECRLMMIDAPDGSARLWCPMCGRFKDAA